MTELPAEVRVMAEQCELRPDGEAKSGLSSIALPVRAGWSLTWATGPFGSRTGPTASAAAGVATLVLDLDQDGPGAGED